MHSETSARIQRLLDLLYPGQTAQVASGLMELMEKYRPQVSPRDGAEGSRWSERDTALITYGDQVSDGDKPTLDALRQFLVDHRLPGAFSIVHILPFCPYSSDDGFSVIDFRAVDQRLGDWDALQRLGQNVDLMYDLVLNHISQHSDWFQGFLRGDARCQNWFHVVDPSTDLTQVTRPRSHPLLTRYDSPVGERHVWTTFSDDQVDLNYSDPALLLEMVDILLMYVERGGRVIRLDAIAFLWKEIGTTCLHLEQTHAVVKLFRAVLDEIAPHVILLTETNVPHQENVSYFGDGDEAHMVYNFSLPPLLFDAYVNQDASPLIQWMRHLQSPPPGATWFNFTASHDGIGVRPLEGLVEGERFQRLIDATRDRGGEVSMRTMPNGELRPYELNITWRDAMRTPGEKDPHLESRILASQAFMLAIQGLPATYFHALVATPNDVEGMQASGHARRINRRKYNRQELDALIEDDPIQSRIFKHYRDMLAIRRLQPAFHPEGGQRLLDSDDEGVVIFQRQCPHGTQAITVAANFTNQLMTLPLNATPTATVDLLNQQRYDAGGVVLQPCQLVWLVHLDNV